MRERYIYRGEIKMFRKKEREAIRLGNRKID